MIKYICYFFCAAIVACSTISENNKTAADYNAQLGLMYLEQGNINLAKSKLLLALKQSPDEPLILDAMAYFLECTGEIKSAENYYLYAIKRAPKNGAVQNNYGTFLCRQKRYQESLGRFLLAVKDSNYLNTAHAYENASQCAAKIPNKKLAKEYMQKALAGKF